VSALHLLVLSDASASSLLPALELLDHRVTTAPMGVDGLGEADVVVIDATTDLGKAAVVCRAAAGMEVRRPVLLVVGEGGLAVLKASWGFDDWVHPSAQPGEVETRLRLLVEREGGVAGARTPATTIGDLAIDEDTYIVRLRGVPLDLTYREFELLKYLAANPGRVFTRGHLLLEVWGYDYYGGTRTVDVHIRRLRAKLGPEHEHLIGTVRGVGYKLDPDAADAEAGDDEPLGTAPG
jgi:DNA-binding response OmpR family regulator